MLKVRQRYRLRDLRKLRREGSLLTLKQLETLLSLYPMRSYPPAGSTWQTLPIADSLQSSDPTESLPKPFGETLAESTAETASGSLGADGPTPTLAD